MSSAVELETGHCYVAVGTERFKKLPYVELLVSKATERYCFAKTLCVFMCLFAGCSAQYCFSLYFVDIIQEREGC